MHECDLLLPLGTDFPYDKFLPTKPKIVQVDIRVDNLGRRISLLREAEKPHDKES